MAESDREPTVDELVARLDRARNRIAADLAATRAAADVISRARASFKAHALRWLAGAAIAGVAVSRFGFARRKRPAKIAAPAAVLPQGSRLAAVLAVLMPLLQPAVVAFAKRLAADWVARRDRR